MSDLDDYDSLPEDSELAFVELERRLRRELLEASSGFGPPTESELTELRIKYARRLMAFHDANEFDFLAKPDLNRSTSLAVFEHRFAEFSDSVDYACSQIKIRTAKRGRTATALLLLAPNVKQQIHIYIGKIREILLPLNIGIKKKNSLLSKLNTLASEVDRDLTRTDAVLSIMIEAASATGKAAKQLEPVVELAEKIVGVFGKALGASDASKALPSPEKPKQIEGPKNKDEARKKPATDADDGDPF